MNDAFHLARFVEAQDPVFASVVEELRRGCKEGHWMWFIFPQIEGLGKSETARYFGIRSLAEAQAYLEHPVLGPRLAECARLVNEVEGRSIEAILGEIDAMKFRSSMTLFEATAGKEGVFGECLRKYFGGERDPMTLARL